MSNIIYKNQYGMTMGQHDSDYGLDMYSDPVPVKLLELFIASSKDVIENKLSAGNANKELEITSIVMSTLHDYACKRILNHPLHKNNKFDLILLSYDDVKSEFPSSQYNQLESKAKEIAKDTEALLEEIRDESNEKIVKSRITYSTLRIAMEILAKDYKQTRHPFPKDKYEKIIRLFEEFKPKGKDNFTEMFYDMLIYSAVELSNE